MKQPKFQNINCSFKTLVSVVNFFNEIQKSSIAQYHKTLFMKLLSVAARCLIFKLLSFLSKDYLNQIVQKIMKFLGLIFMKMKHMLNTLHQKIYSCKKKYQKYKINVTGGNKTLKIKKNRLIWFFCTLLIFILHTSNQGTSTFMNSNLSVKTLDRGYLLDVTFSFITKKEPIK